MHHLIFGFIVNKLPKTSLSLICGALLLCSCLHKESGKISDISARAIPDIDENYKRVYKRYSRKTQVIDNFETKLIAQMTLLGSDLRQIMSDRYASIFNEVDPILTGASNQTGFFVSIFVPHQYVDLSDNETWKIHLSKGEEKFSPVIIKKLSQKDKWKIFFPEINTWSKEFLVVFNETAPRGSEQRLVNQEPVKLTISSIYGIVAASW